MSGLNLVDTRLALVLVNITFNLPFAIVIMRQAFIDLPIELEEAAMVDGASPFGTFARIALRLTAPAMAATLMIVLAFSWNELLFALNSGHAQRQNRARPRCGLGGHAGHRVLVRRRKGAYRPRSPHGAGYFGAALHRRRSDLWGGERMTGTVGGMSTHNIRRRSHPPLLYILESHVLDSRT